METAANATTGTPPTAGDWQRAARGPKPAVSSGVPHVLARLPDLRITRQQPSEPPRSQQTIGQPVTSQPAANQQAISRPPVSDAVEHPASARTAASVEIGADTTSEFFEPQGLPPIDRVWQDTRQWISKHAKVAMFIVALLASNSLLFFWRQTPTERRPDQVLQPLGEQLESPAVVPNQLNPIPMESDVATSRVPPTGLSSPPLVDEPHLALPQPQPDPISLSVPPRPGIPDETGETDERPKLAATLKRDEGHAKVREHEPAAESIGGGVAKPAIPTVDEKDIPPWENWSNQNSSPESALPATEAAAQVTPALTPPDGSGPITKLPDDERTASLSTDRPSSRAGSLQRPRAVAKLKGTINKPLAEPPNERTRRSLY